MSPKTFDALTRSFEFYEKVQWEFYEKNWSSEKEEKFLLIINEVYTALIRSKKSFKNLFLSEKLLLSWIIRLLWSTHSTL